MTAVGQEGVATVNGEFRRGGQPVKTTRSIRRLTAKTLGDCADLYCQSDFFFVRPSPANPG